jgi:hypothetical protein
MKPRTLGKYKIRLLKGIEIVKPASTVALGNIAKRIIS